MKTTGDQQLVKRINRSVLLRLLRAQPGPVARTAGRRKRPHQVDREPAGARAARRRLARRGRRAGHRRPGAAVDAAVHQRRRARAGGRRDRGRDGARRLRLAPGRGAVFRFAAARRARAAGGVRAGGADGGGGARPPGRRRACSCRASASACRGRSTTPPAWCASRPTSAGATSTSCPCSARPWRAKGCRASRCSCRTTPTPAVLGEFEFSDGEGEDPLIFVSCDVGVGAGVVLNDRLFTGAQRHGRRDRPHRAADRRTALLVRPARLRRSLPRLARARPRAPTDRPAPRATWACCCRTCGSLSSRARSWSAASPARRIRTSCAAPSRPCSATPTAPACPRRWCGRRATASGPPPWARPRWRCTNTCGRCIRARRRAPTGPGLTRGQAGRLRPRPPAAPRSSAGTAVRPGA